MNLPPLINVNSHKFVVIIPAAGTSERLLGTNNGGSRPGSARNSPARFGSCAATTTGGIVVSPQKSAAFRTGQGQDPKQYQVVCERPLIFHTVSSFLKLKWIDHIIVVAPADSVAKMEKILSPLVSRQQKRFDCIPGAPTRHRSIREAVQFLAESRHGKSHIHQSTTASFSSTTTTINSTTSAAHTTPFTPDIVVVHDGARPVVDGDTLHQLVSNCFEYGAAGTVCKLTSTIVSAKQINEQLWKMGSALDRTKYWASEMPQAFRFNLLCEAYNKCTEHELDHNTECLDLVQRYTKTDARLIQVDPNLYFKVTYRKDLYAADNVLKERRNVLLHCDFIEKQMSVNFTFIKQLKDDLCANFTAVNYFNNSNVADKYQSNAAIHSTGIVHILLHYCHSWVDIVQPANENNLAAYESLIYIVVLSEHLRKCSSAGGGGSGTVAKANGHQNGVGSGSGGDGPTATVDKPPPKASQPKQTNSKTLDDSAYPQLIQWSRKRVPTIKNFYLIMASSDNLDQDSQRIRNTVVYLCKELPAELSGQSFFM